MKIFSFCPHGVMGTQKIIGQNHLNIFLFKFLIFDEQFFVPMWSEWGHWEPKTKFTQNYLKHISAQFFLTFDKIGFLILM